METFEIGIEYMDSETIEVEAENIDEALEKAEKEADKDGREFKLVNPENGKYY